MTKTLDSTLSVLSENKIEDLDNLVHTSQALIGQVKEIQFDTIDLVFAITLDRYKRMTDDILPAQTSYDEIEEQGQLEREVLTQLMDDIEHGSGKRNKYDEHIRFESEKITQLKTAIDGYVDRKNKIVHAYEELHNMLSDSIAERNASGEVQ